MKLLMTVLELRFRVARFASDSGGATAIEYGLLAALAAVGLAGGFGMLSDLVIGIFEMLGDQTDSVTTAASSGG